MKNKLAKIIAAIVAVVFAGGLVAAPAFAADDPFCNENMGSAARDAMHCDDGQDTDITVVVLRVVSGVLALLGIVAVVFIIIGGVGYMTSTGDAGKVKKAKDTILYAVIGLIICALSFAIVNTAIGIINDDGNSGSSQEGEGQQ